MAHVQNNSPALQGSLTCYHCSRPAALEHVCQSICLAVPPSAHSPPRFHQTVLTGYDGRSASQCPQGSWNTGGNLASCTQCGYGLTTADTWSAATHDDEQDCKLARGFGYDATFRRVIPCPTGERYKGLSEVFKLKWQLVQNMSDFLCACLQMF